ncbi:MAG: hypothetical protein ACRD59_10590 [Candidatus Acidiferrales bacterium]
MANERTGRLGILWAIYGVVRLVAVVLLVFFNGTATVMFGALLSRVPNPFALMADFHLIYILAVAWNLLLGIVALAAAGDLLSGRPSGRKVAILAGFLALPEMPFGVMLGVYTLILLLPPERRTA